jgi:hypothetical protein
MYSRKLWLLRRDLLCHCPQGQEAAAGYAPPTIGFDGVRNGNIRYCSTDSNNANAPGVARREQGDYGDI